MSTEYAASIALSHTVLAHGPWDPAAVETTWSQESYQPSERLDRAADAAIERLRQRGSPSHDGLSARLAGYTTGDRTLQLELQPLRWSLRLVPRDSSQALSALAIVRDAEGRWLAGRRAQWLATWPGRWSLGAGGAVEIGENPVDTLTRELREEWSAQGERIDVQALLLTQNNGAILLGQVWLPDGADVTPDDEHDEYAWWPAAIADWPREGHAALRRLAELIS